MNLDAIMAAIRKVLQTTPAFYGKLTLDVQNGVASRMVIEQSVKLENGQTKDK